MENYKPTMDFEQEHTILYTFQYENAFAQIITTMGGNVSGGSVMDTEFDVGLTVPADHELTKKHVQFFDDEDSDKPYREVGEIIFHYPNGDTLEVDLEDCGDFLVNIAITDYKSGR
jgi:hypothetical protein